MVKRKVYMDTTQDILFERWEELKDQVRKHWSKLTDDELAQLSGRTEDLASVLRKRYGYGKTQAEIEISIWLQNLDKRTKMTR